MKKAVIITGALGGIGKALCKVFSEHDHFVIGIDRCLKGEIPHCNTSINSDLSVVVKDKTYREQLFTELSSVKGSLVTLINNAAVQHLGSTLDIDEDEWNDTLNVNLSAPLILSKWAIPLLSKNEGSIINIASIHQQLTKPKFVAYSTSKSALVGLTKSMAVDLAGSVRVNSISPAAIETDMLKAGFDSDQDALDKLRALHPSQRIGHPEEVAKLALCLSSGDLGFVNGANFCIDGGISSVLHDI